MAITLVILAGLVQMLSSTRQNTSVQQNNSALQDNGRFAAEYISRSIQKAGFKSSRLSDNESAFPAGSGFATAAGVTGNSVSLSVRYSGGTDAFMSNCMNTAANLEGLYIETWTVNSGELRCQLTTPAGAQAALAVLSGVEALDFRYGVDTNADLYPDEYRTGAGVTDWSAVRSVNARIRLVSQDNNLNETAVPYLGFDGARVTPTDRRLRRLVTTTIALRNLLP
jgi:type IV pilus assembly protein PilW